MEPVNRLDSRFVAIGIGLSAPVQISVDGQLLRPIEKNLNEGKEFVFSGAQVSAVQEDYFD
jgi:hypothetical protein